MTGSPEAEWKKQGATLSQKNASKEFGIAGDILMLAIKSGTLQYRLNYAHGNPWFRLLRKEVEALVKTIKGSDGVRNQERQHKLETMIKEIRTLKRRITVLEKEKAKLEAEAD